jgi:hypothetical protein
VLLTCTVCPATYQTEEERREHMEGIHHWVYQREGETLEEAKIRVRTRVGPCSECDAPQSHA